MANASDTDFTPTEIRVHQTSRVIEISFVDDKTYALSFEFLRVHSPSAEVRGHGPGQEVLQTGKRNVDIVSVDPVGNYAIQPHFSDGHTSGIFSWDYLRDLGMRRDELWDKYLKQLRQAGASRD
jgi:DUF971 family protein